MKKKVMKPVDPIDMAIDHQRRSNFCLVGLPSPSKHSGVDNSIESRIIGAIDRKYHSENCVHRILYLVNCGYNIKEIAILLNMPRRFVSNKVKELASMGDEVCDT